MLDKIKNPFILGSILGSAVLIFGSLLTWFSFKDPLINDIVSALSGDEYQGTKNAAIVAGLVGLGVTLAVIKTRQRYLALVTVAVGIYITREIYNKLPTDADKDLLTIATEYGYWVAIIGAIVMTVSAIACVFRLRRPEITKKEVSEN